MPASAPAAPPPAAPAPAAPSAPAPAPKAAPAAPATKAAAAPAPVKSDMDSAFDMIDRFADDGEPNGKATPKPIEAPKTVDPKLEQPKAETHEEEAPETTPTDAPKPGEKGKVSPWKVIEQHKSKIAQLEKELADVKTNPAVHPQFKEIAAKAEAIAKRNEELENHIRYVDYSKSKEFTEQYQKPYEEAWAKAVSELKELTVETEDGMSRAATAQDMVALCNMPLKQAREAAKAWFGDCADDVIAHRRQIRDLSEKQTKALENAKTQAGEREKQWSSEHQKAEQQLQEEIGNIWKSTNDEAMQKYEFLKPSGDPERDEKLTKAIAFVDEAFAASARDPKLTPQQRAEVIKKHAALRNRSIAYSPLLHENKKLRAQLAEKDKALAAYQQSEPGKGNGQSNHQDQPTSGNLMDDVLRSFDKVATRG